MDYELRVGEVKCLGERPDDQVHLLYGMRPRRLITSYSVGPLDVLEDSKGVLSMETEVMDRRDGWMCQVGPDPGLFDKPVPEFLFGSCASREPNPRPGGSP